MNADRQPQAFRQPVDRPELPPAERDLAGDQHKHLHETKIVGTALDFRDRKLGIVRRDHDGGAQPWIAAQPLVADPVVGRPAERRGHVFAVKDLCAIEAVENSEARLIAIEHMRLHRFQRRSRLSPMIERPIWAARQRRVLWIAGETEVETIERANPDHLAPIVVEIWQKHAHPGQGGMKVTIDRTGVFR